MDLSDLKTMLETQYGTFLRDDRYKSAFEKAMKHVDNISMQHSPRKIDTFYAFLHLLILNLFDEIEQLHRKIDLLEK